MRFQGPDSARAALGVALERDAEVPAHAEAPAPVLLRAQPVVNHEGKHEVLRHRAEVVLDRKSTRLNSSH